MKQLMRNTKSPDLTFDLVHSIDAASESRRTLLAIGKLLAACRDGQDALEGQTVAQIGELIVAEIGKMDSVFGHLTPDVIRQFSGRSEIEEDSRSKSTR